MKAKEEHEHQSAFFDLVRRLENSDARLRTIFAVPNGDERPLARGPSGKLYCPSGQRLKREGVRRGVPDVMCPFANRDYIGLAIEFKSRKGNLSEHQEMFVGLLEKMGWKVAVCRSVDVAWSTLQDYLRH